ncbi:hypothetical protein [Streptomyces sp. NPDC005507]|uniref:hypothetical protein n=1 Tax=Streptomyces sp. NPDC005507 TaxID=3154885 RepID=UPI0033ABF3B4
MSVWAVRRYGLEFAKALQLLTEGQEFGPGGALCRAALALASPVRTRRPRKAWCSRGTGRPWRTTPGPRPGGVTHRRSRCAGRAAARWRSRQEARWALRAHDDAAAAACTAELAADIAAACGRTALAVELLCSGDALRDGHGSGAAYCAPVPRRCETALRDVVGAEAERTTA